MKPGARALGVAESYRGRADGERESVLGGVVVRADRVVEDVALSTCTVGGADATAAVCELVASVDREDLGGLLLAGVAPAWFNVVDLAAVRDAVDRPVLAVSFEASDGLEPHLRDHFDGGALERRLAAYRSLPDRIPVRLDAPAAAGGDDTDADLWVRAVGVGDDEARRIVRAHTPEGRRRPEPLRVAKVAARAGHAYLDDPGPGGADAPDGGDAGRADGAGDG